MLEMCLVFWKSEPQYDHKRYAYKKKHVFANILDDISVISIKNGWYSVFQSQR